MAAESIATYKKLVNPEYRVSDKSVRTDIDYIGPYSTLFATLSSSLNRGQPWGDYPGLVTDINIRSIEGTNPVIGELTVSVEYELTDGGGDFGIDPGESTGTVYEIDWTVVSRPLIEHKVFASGGFYSLDEEDLKKIAVWEADKTDANFIALGSSNAEKYAYGILRGIESWDDFAPVLTKTTTYVNGIPPNSTAGFKDTPGGFPNMPSGYEWVKTADRSLRNGTRDKWDRTEQWSGSNKVLVDKNDIYY